MDKKDIFLVFFISLVLFLPFVESADPGHDASEVSAGVFELGNFTFPDSLSVAVKFNATEICIGSVCRTSWLSEGESSPFAYTGTEVRLNDTFTSLNISDTLFVNKTGLEIFNSSKSNTAPFKVSSSSTGDGDLFQVDNNGMIRIGGVIDSEASVLRTQGSLIFGDGTKGVEGIVIYTGTTGTGKIIFADDYLAPGNSQGFLFYNHGHDTLALGSGGVTQIYINGSANNVGMGTATGTSKLNVVGDINITGGISTNMICIDSFCHTAIPLNTTFTQYDTWNFNQSALSIGWVEGQGYVTSTSAFNDSAINQTIASINTTGNMIALEMGLNATFSQYDGWNINQSALTMAWVIAQSYPSGMLNATFLQYDTWNQNQTDEAIAWAEAQGYTAGAIPSAQLNATYGLNTTFSQYDSWNFNQSALSIGWVEGQGYVTSASFDGNVSSICGDNEVLLGQDDPFCVDLNATIDDRDADTTYTIDNNLTLTATELGINGTAIMEWLDDVFYDSEVDLTTLLDDNYIAMGDILNATFLQYDTWNINESIAVQSWVSEQGYLTEGVYDDTAINVTIQALSESNTTTWAYAVNHQMNYTNVAMLNESQTYNGNITMLQESVLKLGTGDYQGNITTNGTCTIISGMLYLCPP